MGLTLHDANHYDVDARSSGRHILHHTFAHCDENYDECGCVHDCGVGGSSPGSNVALTAYSGMHLRSGFRHYAAMGMDRGSSPIA
jgi:hypothetical protein